MNSAYEILAPFYDRLNGGSVDYDGWADFVTEKLRKYGVPDKSTLLDLACGTGKMTLRLAERGYDMIGVDLSPEMLSVAREACAECGYFPLLICQDMCSLDLYGTVEGAICCLDSVNYLTGAGELDDLLSRMRNFVSPGGIFLFDVNTARKFREVYGQNCYTYDSEEVFCVWQNDFRAKSGLCDFDLVFFIKEKGGKYRREEEHQQERYYSPEVLRRSLESHGFETLEIVSDFASTPAKESDLRHYYICRRTEGQ